GEPLEPLGRIAQLVEAVVEGAVLAAVHRLLADEAGDLAPELGIGDPVAELSHRPDEEVLAVGEDRGQGSGEVAENQVLVDGEVPRHVLQRVLEGEAAGRHGAGGDAGSSHFLNLDGLSDSFKSSANKVRWRGATDGGADPSGHPASGDREVRSRR